MIYADPQGDDRASGGAEAPVRTITAAALAGGEVALAPGDYPLGLLSGRRSAADPLVIHASGATVAGLNVRGAVGVLLLGGLLTGTVSVEARSKLTDPSTDVTLDGFHAIGAGLRVLNGSRRVTARNCSWTDVYTAVSGPGRTAAGWESSEVTIEDFKIDGCTSDGMQIGDWNDVVIRRGTIRGVRDPVGQIHNDCVQFTGGTRNVLIEKVTGVGASSFVLAQPQIRPMSGLTIRRCLAYGQWSVSVQVQGVPGTVVEHCTLEGRNGGLWLRKGGAYSEQTRDTIVRGNSLSSFRTMDGCAAAAFDCNTVTT